MGPPISPFQPRPEMRTYNQGYGTATDLFEY
jgi:hypothetical protein